MGAQETHSIDSIARCLGVFASWSTHRVQFGLLVGHWWHSGRSHAVASRLAFGLSRVYEPVLFLRPVDWSKQDLLLAVSTQLSAFGMMSCLVSHGSSFWALVDDVVTKHVPPHIGLFYCLGGIVFMALVAQFTSGLVLTFYFTPTVDDAYLSVEPLELSRHSGQLFGSVHRWASNLMLLAILLHLSRVYLTGGLKKPRELTWVSGALLSFLALSFGVSGERPFTGILQVWCLRTSLEVLEMPSLLVKAC